MTLAARTAILAALILTGCSVGEVSTEPGLTVAEAPAHSERFQKLWTETTDLIDDLDPEAQPSDADEANDAAGLDQNSPLYYADMGSAPNGGRWCIESDDDTYVAFTYGNGASTILMGDGTCTYDAYDAAKAKVIGDFMTAEWTHGETLMGDVSASPDA